MPKLTTFPGANTTAQWYARDYPGQVFTTIEKIVLHTTEGRSWPGYWGGKQAPTLTALPDMSTRRLIWRQHFPVNMSARALQNRPGGAETNRDRAVQVELIGTCASNGPGLYWPGAPDWALDGVAEFLAWMKIVWAVPIEPAPLWLRYPGSYGNTIARMSAAKWEAFRGFCGHQHVVENLHGDPGNIDAPKIARFAKLKVGVIVAPPSPVTGPPVLTRPAIVYNTEKKDMGTFTNVEIKAIVADAVQGMLDEIATEVWNRFAIRDEAGQLVKPMEAIQALYRRSNDQVTLAPETMDALAVRIAEELKR